MMSQIFTIKKGGKHVAYLSATEYFVTASNEAREASHWQGVGAAVLGLEGKKVDVQTFENILHGKDPDGNSLTKNANSKTREKLGFDCVNSPPKSVSMIMAFAEPWLRDEIIKASEAANAASMKYITDNLSIRTGKGGDHLEPVGGAIIATFTHMASRALDMDMHHHNALASMAMRQDGTWGSIDGAEVMALHQTAGAIYRAELAQKLCVLGFTTIADEKQKFAFKVQGFGEDQEKEFSQSRNKILKWLKEKNLSPSDTKACQRAARAARDNKNEPNFRDLITLWKARGKDHGITEETVNTMRHGISQDATEALKPQEILDALTEQNSVFERKDVLKAVAIEASKNGGMTLADIEKTTDQILNGEAFALGHHVKKSDRITDELRKNEAVKLGDYTPKIKNKKRPPTALKERALYTTPDAIKRDIAIVSAFDAANKDTQHNRTEDQVQAAIEAYQSQKSQEFGTAVKMKDEQVECLKHCATAGRQILIQGLSGTGKSFTMGAVRAMEEAAGQTVIGIALAGQAAASLKEGAGIKEGGTLASTLLDIKNGRLIADATKTFVVDEAAMIGAKQIRELQQAAPQSKIIILGDRLQYQNIEAGAWMGGLQDMGYSFAKLSDIERQKIDWHKQAVLNLKDGRGAEALQAFKDNGLIAMEDSTEKALKSMALDYTNDKTSELDKVMMTSTHADARAVNEEVRKLKIERGELGRHGTWVEFSSKDDKASYEREIRIGDRLRFTKNAKLLNIFNGQHGTIEKITPLRDGDTELVLKHDQGQAVTFRLSEYSKLEYGYCGTGMGNQGASKTHAYTFLDASMLNKQAGYVLASRSKQETKLYMTTADSDDAADAFSKLGRAISRDGSKDWTLDYLTAEQRQKFTAPHVEQKQEAQAIKQAPAATTVKPVEAKPVMPPPPAIKQAGPRLRM